MKKEEFEIEKEFYTQAGKWLCTDIGKRVIVAIHLYQNSSESYSGPPYSVPEIVFDEYDFDGCSPDPSDLEDKEEIFIKSKRFSEIEYAMMFVSALPYGENSAFLDISTGKIYYQSSYTDFDESDELSEEDYDPKIHIKIPHKNDLNLGRDLVFKFVEQNIPEVHEKVYQIFKKRGAYSRFKDLLDSKGVLQQWYDFENRQEQSVLLKWCEENNIDFK